MPLFLGQRRFARFRAVVSTRPPPFPTPAIVRRLPRLEARIVDRLDTLLHRGPELADLDARGGVWPDLGGTRARRERRLEAGALADLAGPHRDLQAVEIGARLRNQPGLLVVALHRRGVDHHRIGAGALARDLHG